MQGLVLVALLLSLCSAKDFYVTPTLPPIQACLTPCYTLDQYAQNTSLFENQVNITLKFLSGNHSLNSSLVMIGDELILRPTQSEVFFSDCVFICGSEDFDIIELAGKNVRIEYVTLIRIDVTLGVHAAEPVDAQSVFISGCGFFSSSLHIGISFPANGLISDSVFCGDYQQFVGIVILHKQSVSNQILTIYNCSISQYVTGIIAASISIAIVNTHFTQNTQGLVASSLSSMLLDSSTVSYSEQYGLFVSFMPNVTANIINSDIAYNEIGISLALANMAVSNTLIRNNTVGFVAIDTTDNASSFSIELNSCYIMMNNLSGISLYFQRNIIFNNCSFSFNTGTPIFAYQSTFELRGNTTFSNNKAEQGGGLSLYQSTVTFGQGSNTLFKNNTASQYGGAIYIAAVPLPLPQIVVALENSLSVFLSVSKKIVTSKSCFYSTASASYDTSVTFSHNSASLGGRSIYGIETSSYTTLCPLDQPSIFEFDGTEPIVYQLASDPTRVCFCLNNMPQCSNRNFLVLNETRYPGETFKVSVALVGFNYGRVVGTVFANVLGSNTATLEETQGSQFISDYTQCNDLTYTLLSNSTNKAVKVALMVDELFLDQTQKDDFELNIRNAYTSLCDTLLPPCTALLTTPVYLNVTLEECPQGFKLNKMESVCNCDENIAMLRDENILDLTCEIKDRIGYITRKSTVWIGVDVKQNNDDVYYWHRHCPRDYCNTQSVSVDLKTPDTQCSMNRTGVLCGSCSNGYSLQLGGNKCVQCDDSFLALLIVFGVFGVLLVAFINILDFTVSGGAINGLIFYANILWINNPILFPLQDRQTIAHYIFAVPIAWINLDFGIESCFSKNLDQLTKTGLQFVFPVYIWCITGIIILVSHYSTRATKLFGKNSVSVLGTLFLLSYGKIFRTITDVFISADIYNSNGSVRKVWSLDGNVVYGVTTGHILLLMIAIIFIILFLIPFTLTLLLVPFLKAKSNAWPLRWINKLHPFFDAFYGPLKVKKQHQVWVGILLVARVIILMVFASTSTFNPFLNILLLVLVAILLHMYSSLTGLLYKAWLISLSEIMYIVNLAILGGVFYQLQEQQQQSSVAVFVSVGIALFQFVLILIVHIGKKLRKAVSSTLVNKKEIQVTKLEENKEQFGVTTQVVELNNYDPSILREPLLND